MEGVNLRCIPVQRSRGWGGEPAGGGRRESPRRDKKGREGPMRMRGPDSERGGRERRREREGGREAHAHTHT